MINNIGDIVRDMRDNLCIVADVEFLKENTYMFYLYNLREEKLHRWFEPFGQELAPNYWDTLA